MTTMPTAADLMPLLPELLLVAGAFALLMLDLFLGESRRIVMELSEVSAKFNLDFGEQPPMKRRIQV